MTINKIYNEPALITLNRIPSNSIIDGIITSPPYNINTKRNDNYYNNGYSEHDGLSEENYLSLRLSEFMEFDRVLKKGGVICYNISYSKDNPILPILLVSEVHNKTNLTLVDIISWKKNVSMPLQSSSNRLSRIVELIYIFVHKDEIETFKANKIISKINERTGQRFYKKYVNYIEAKNNDGFKCKLKASYSQELCDKLIEIYFPPNSLIYDPFTGIGTTQLSCIRNGCNYLGSELIQETYEIAINRLK